MSVYIQKRFDFGKMSVLVNYLFTDNYPIEKMFMRHNRLAFSEIIGYKADANLKWLAITGLIPEVRKKAIWSQGVCDCVSKEWTMMCYFLVFLLY